VKLAVALPALVGAAALATPAFADGGYYGGALGARAAGRSGAFAARADDLTAVSYNPAGIANVGGLVVEIGNRVSNNGYAYTRAPTLDWGNAMGGQAPTVSFDQVKNASPWQPAEPFISIGSNLGLKDWGFALSLFPNPGASKGDFPADGGQRYMMVSREAIFLNIAGTAAWKYHDVFGVGVTAEWIYVPRLNYSLVVDGTPFVQAGNPVTSPLDMMANTSGSDPFTFNAILGAWFRPTPSFQIGVAGQVVPTSIETKSKLVVTPVDPSIGGTLELRRNDKPANDVNVILPLPLMARAGARYRHLDGGRELFDIELDVEYETWSRVKNFSVESNHLIATIDGVDVDLKTIYVPKYWNDTVAVKLGGDFAVVPGRWTLRAGGFYETAVADKAYSNVDFPGGAMFGGSLGTSVIFERFEIALAYQLRHMQSVSVTEQEGRVYQQVPKAACQPPYTDTGNCSPHYLGQPAPTVNAGRYAAVSHYLLLAVVYRYGS
jgi:long-subunit fatty acid transport protein